MVTIDTLELEIQHKATDAAKAIDTLASSLKNLKGAVNGRSMTALANSFTALGSALNTIDGAKLTSVASALQSLSGIGKANPISRSFTDGLVLLGLAANDLTNEQIDKIERVGIALQGLSGFAGAQGISKSLINNIQDLAVACNNITHSQIKKIRDLGNALQGLSGFQGAKGLKIVATQAKSTTKEITKTASAAKKASGAFGKLASSFMRITFYRIVRSIIKSISQALNDGVKCIYQYSNAIGGAFAKNMDGLASSFQTMKAGLGAFSSQIITLLAPVLNAAMNAITNLANALARLFAILNGSSTYTKAIASTTKFAEATSDAAKAQKDLSVGMDELNVLNDSSSSGGASGTDPSKMFEEADTGAMPEGLQSILSFIERIKTSTSEWLSTLDFSKLNESFNKLKAAIEPLVSLISDGLAWAWENVLLPLGKWTIEEALPAVISTLASAFEILNGVLEKIKPGLDYLWNNFLLPLMNWSGEAVTLCLETIAGTLEATAEWFNGDISFEEWAQRVQDTFTPLKEFIEDTFQTITDKLSEWADGISGRAEENLSPVIDKISEWFEKIPEKIKDAFDFKKTLSEFKDNASTWIEENIPPIIDSVSEWFEELPGKIGYEFGYVLGAIHRWRVELLLWIATKLPEVINNIVEFFSKLPERIGEWLSKVNDTANKWIDDIKTFITEKIPSVINDIVNWFAKLPDALVDVGKNMIIGLWNGVISMGNWLVEKISGFFGGLWDGVSDFFSGFTEGFAEGFYDPPTFASGGFPQTGSMFIANEQGPELVGRIGSRTAVANNDQIIAGISSGVYDAVVSAMGSVGSRESNINVYLDGKQIEASTRKTAQRRGATIARQGVVNYAY